MRNAQTPAERWKSAAEAFGMKVPPERLERAAVVYDALWKAVRPSLDRDYSLVEPDFQFRPDGR